MSWCPWSSFWFMYFPVEDITHTPHTPTYTNADCADAIKKYGNRKMGSNYTFSDLFENRLSATMVPKEEVVIQAKWSNGDRVVMLGEAVPKVRTFCPSSAYLFTRI